MPCKIFYTPERLIEELMKRRIVPLEIIKVRMFEDVGYRYLYMFRVSSYEWWIIDECTDYSGCGSHNREVMEKLVKHYRSIYGKLVKYEEYEVPSKVYHLLKNTLYEAYKGN